MGWESNPLFLVLVFVGVVWFKGMADTPAGMDILLPRDLASLPPRAATEYFEQQGMQGTYAHILRELTGDGLDKLGVRFGAGPPRITGLLGADASLAPKVREIFTKSGFRLERPELTVRTRDEMNKEGPAGVGIIFFEAREGELPVMRTIWLVADQQFKAPVPAWVNHIKLEILTTVDETGVHLPMGMWPKTLYPQKKNKTDRGTGIYMSEIHCGVDSATNILEVFKAVLKDLRDRPQFIPPEPDEMAKPRAPERVTAAGYLQKAAQPLGEVEAIKAGLDRANIKIVGDERFHETVPSLLRRLSS